MISADAGQVLKAGRGLVKALTDVDHMGRVMQYAAQAIWIPNIMGRLMKSTSTSGYEVYLDKTMFDLDKGFVERLSSPQSSDAWALKTQAERKIPGGYVKGSITEAIADAIKVSPPIKTSGMIVVGIASLDELNSLFTQIKGSDKIRIWQILHYGTGVYTPGGAKIERNKKQVYYDPKAAKSDGSPGAGVLASYGTSNKGFRGREFFVQLDGTFHESDYATRSYILKYMKKAVEKYSYKKGRK